MLSGLKSLTPFLMITTLSCLNALSIEGGFVHVVEVEPGKTYQQQIILKNEQDEMVKVRIHAMDCQQSKSELTFLPAGTLDRSNASWIDVVHEVELSPKSKAPIPFKITVPRNAPAGSSWCALTFTLPAAQEKALKNEMRQVATVKTPQGQNSPLANPVVVYESIPLGSIVAPGLALQVVTRRGPSTRGPVLLKSSQLLKNSLSTPQWQVCIQNAGPSDLLLKSTLELRTLQGVLVSSIPGPSQLVLPGALSDYTFNLDKPVSGTYEAFVILEDASGNRFHVQAGLTL